MQYRILPVTALQQNCSLIWCEATRRAALVDPGGDEDELLAAAQREGVTIEKLLLTHGHVDHVAAAATLAHRLNVPIEGPHADDAFWLEALPQQAAHFGFPHAEPFVPDRWLADGDVVSVGQLKLEVLHCPGHTPGHVVLFARSARVAFVGDVLFHGSIGRTDFPRGNHRALIDAITRKLLPLGDDVTFVPGHGPTSTFGEERRSNPFLNH
jgi:glyoxylase-like metal-dependent hydrolase (beta-lactamase superfamily II)